MALANQIDGNINEIKELLNVNIRTMPRHALDTIETEYIISNGSSNKDILYLLKNSNILITGLWQDQGTSLKLTVKAISIKDRDMVQLTAISKDIEMETIPEKLKSCFSKGSKKESIAHKHNRSQKVRISFFSANISSGRAYAADDSNPAPDSYILIKSEDGKTLFSSAQYFMKNWKYGTLLKNRNNYHPDFRGLSYCHDFGADGGFRIYLVDYDGIEELMGSKKSSDDIIGGYCMLDQDHSLGASLILANGWEMNIEMVGLK